MSEPAGRVCEDPARHRRKEGSPKGHGSGVRFLAFLYGRLPCDKQVIEFWLGGFIAVLYPACWCSPDACPLRALMIIREVGAHLLFRALHGARPRRLSALPTHGLTALPSHHQLTYAHCGALPRLVLSSSTPLFIEHGLTPRLHSLRGELTLSSSLRRPAHALPKPTRCVPACAQWRPPPR